MSSEMRKYVILPAHGYESATLSSAAELQHTAGSTVWLEAPHVEPARSVSDADREIRILHSTHENGPKLVEMSEQAELNLRRDVPGLKVVPVIEYAKMRARPELQREAETAASRPGFGSRFMIRDKETGRSVRGADVVAFTNYRHRRGEGGSTDSDGSVTLSLAPGTRLDRLYVFGPPKYWGHYAAAKVIEPENTVEIEPIDLNSQDLLLTRTYGHLSERAGEGIVVAIIDSGVAKDHPALSNLAGGANMVTAETTADPATVDDWGPARVDGDHGTHVAGIVGMRAAGNVRLRGVAPGVTLRSYRVFPNSGGGATNYDVMNAIDRAVTDGCHVINLSLGGGAPDEATRAAIGMALGRGSVVVAAAGNDQRAPVSYPAAWPACIAVSAMGRKGSFPPESSEVAEIASPFGADDPLSFVAAFSNFGPRIDHTGTGVAIVSTLPAKTYGTMNGTSMACPAVAGFAAFLLSENPNILGADGEERSRRLIDALNNSARQLGFGRDYEGFGLPDNRPIA